MNAMAQTARIATTRVTNPSMLTQAEINQALARRASGSAKETTMAGKTSSKGSGTRKSNPPKAGAKAPAKRPARKPNPTMVKSEALLARTPNTGGIKIMGVPLMPAVVQSAGLAAGVALAGIVVNGVQSAIDTLGLGRIGSGLLTGFAGALMVIGAHIAHQKMPGIPVGAMLYGLAGATMYAALEEIGLFDMGGGNGGSLGADNGAGELPQMPETEAGRRRNPEDYGGSGDYGYGGAGDYGFSGMSGRQNNPTIVDSDALPVGMGGTIAPNMYGGGFGGGLYN